MRLFIFSLCVLALLTAPAAANPGITWSGDVNCDGTVNITDAIALDHHINGGDPLCCPRVADVNDDGSVDDDDVNYILDFLFSGGPAPNGPIDICNN